MISIHALREEGDTFDRFQVTPENQFLSTPSARRATLAGCQEHMGRTISIHALREEGDPTRYRVRMLKICYFYPRPPRGGRLNCKRH